MIEQPSSLSIRLATRGSRLARRQAELTRFALQRSFPGVVTEPVIVETLGDRDTRTALAEAAGKSAGLFVKALEVELLEGRADLAVHSAKDLPLELTPGTSLIGFLERADPRDVLVLRDGIGTPGRLATGSPRRRAQMQLRYQGVEWTELRGNVETRLQKIVDGYADGTLLAAAGLSRLGIESWPGLHFETLSLAEMVPAAGQAAVAIQARSGEFASLAAAWDELTGHQVTIERAVLGILGDGGCHTPHAAYCGRDGILHLYHIERGFRRISLEELTLADTAEVLAHVRKELDSV